MLGSIVTAAGAGTRFGAEKILAPVLGQPLLYRTLERLILAPEVTGITLVLPPDRLEAIRDEHGAALAERGVVRYVPGGATRQASVQRGVAALPPEADVILVHDAVRPNVSPAAVSLAVRTAIERGAAIVAVPVRDTLKRASAGLSVVETVPREEIWQAETPQVIRRDIFCAALRKAEEDGFVGTDEASLVEHWGGEVILVRGEPFNIKVTEREDLAVVCALFRNRGDT